MLLPLKHNKKIVMDVTLDLAEAASELPKTRDFARIADRYDDSRDPPPNCCRFSTIGWNKRACCIQPGMFSISDAVPGNYRYH
jgi:hypothetical protein